MIEEELDEALERQAVAEDVSKAALVRRFVRRGLEPRPVEGPDPILQMSGVDDFEPAGVDDIVYR
jgi:hypothetical protein